MTTDDPRVQRLLDQLIESHATPEEVCASCPELLPVVRTRWRQMRLLSADLDLLFPTQGDQLPQIPGYDVQALLGRGGMGIVYLARHLRLNRTVALKMVLAGPYAAREELDRFLHEAEAVAALHHPNIVQVYDAGEFDGRPYFTMEYVEGGRLAQKINGVPQPALSSAKLVATVAEAIHVAHQSAIVHRDLTPANILLTTDGTPKVSDFGLARRVESDGEGGGMTMTGQPMGTPSYMAPEQAQGKKGAIGPATDVYALGAILYELLTGRPPFRAETVTATLQQVMTDDPVRPARLNSRIPRDLETICLKCLQKEPHRRYVSAAALAEDLRRFERGEPILARPPGILGRIMRWVRRRPAMSALLAGSALLAMAVVGGGLWLGWQRAEAVRTVEGDLRELERLEQQSSWTKASSTLARANARLDRWPARELHNRLQQASRDLDLVARLDAIHLTRTAIVEGRIDNRGQAASDYEAAFLQAGLAQRDEAPAVVAERVRVSNVRMAIVATLDDWALCSTDTFRQAWLLEIARRADPQIWRDRVRDLAVWRDQAALAELSRSAPIPEQPVELLVVLADRLQAAGGDAAELLSRVQQENPADFTANFALANVLREKHPVEAIGYYRAAVVARPETAAAHYNLGCALRGAGQQSEAIFCFQRAIALDPRSAWPFVMLGATLQDTRRPDEAIDSYHQAVRLDPKLPWAYFGLGTTLRSRGRTDEAIVSYRQAIQLDPKLPWPHYGLGEVLEDQGHYDDAIDSYKQALQLDSSMAWAHYRLGLRLKAKGKLQEADAQFRQAAQLDPNNVEFLKEVRPVSDAPVTK